eukprot:jgi/Orpsp1_1/1191836/evm.model.d7180000088835.1
MECIRNSSIDLNDSKIQSYLEFLNNESIEKLKLLIDNNNNTHDNNVVLKLYNENLLTPERLKCIIEQCTKNKTPMSSSELNQHLEKYKIPLNSAILENFESWDSTLYLFSACGSGNESAVKYLVEQEANVNKENDCGETPLFYACENGNETIVKYLMEHGANVNKENSWGGTILFNACYYGKESMVKYLMKHEADINKENKEGETPLYYACEGEH